MTVREDSDLPSSIEIIPHVGARRPDVPFTPRLDEHGMVVLKVWGPVRALEDELRQAGADRLPQTTHYATGSDGFPGYVTVALAAGSGVWLTLRTVIRALAERHRHKTFQIDLPGGAFRADGQSAQDVTRLLKAAEETFERRLESHLEAEQTQLEAMEPHLALMEQAVRRLVEHRPDLGIDPDAVDLDVRHQWVARHLNTDLDLIADLAADCRTLRQWNEMAHGLKHVVWKLHKLEQHMGHPTPTTDEARQTLAAAAAVVESLPRDVFGPL